MNILIFGGTFNPVHNGHVLLCKVLSEKVCADKVIIVPTYIPVHKNSSENLISPQHRINMCKIAFSGINNCEINDIEIKKQKPCYTVDTLMDLCNIYQNDNLYFACGSDMFLSLDSWKEPEKLFKLATFCAVPRTDEFELMHKKAIELERLGLKYKIFDIDYIEVSSTEIRENLNKYKNDENIDSKVMEYIKSNHLYGV